MESELKFVVGLAAAILVLLPYLSWMQLVGLGIFIFLVWNAKKVGIILRTLPRDLG